ncbi:MAG TPA: UDP-glucose/GDP-mannose dehydrogenase family protein [Fimbriimonadaceae bacterium]|nr:UDP-glucose/GDP-mannose dehydrogenase family protein [Fimbriimonadaceae bacterium]HRJ95957.1 UDP-glucose/GDP-mannose dehydrogenase family protein [Fimbriimonadaceae bacterium]
MRIAVIGTGYVGLVTGVVMADLGNDVVCIDNNPDKVAMLRQGKSPIFEPGLEPLLQQTLRNGQLRIAESVAEGLPGAEVVIIAVGTPPKEDGSPDLRYVEEVAREIAAALRDYTVIVNKSTVPVGTGDLVERILVENGVPADRFDVVSNPEFLREGSAVEDTLHPDRIVIGVNRREAAEKLVVLYAPLESSMIITDRASAELIKYAANCFLALKISYINAISRICERCGADVGVVAKGIGADARIGRQFLQAGLGWGGSCLPKDVQGLISIANDLGYDFDLMRSVWQINADQAQHFLDRLQERLGGFSGKAIGILGLAFKPNTDDIRHAISLALIERLLGGGASVAAYDPEAASNVRALYPGVRYTASAPEVAENADAVILVTDWPEFRRIDLSKMAESMRQPILFDGRRFFYRAQAEAAGLEYHTIGS